MAVIEIPDEKITLRDENQVRDYLAQIDIEYERWDLQGASTEASPEVLQILKDTKPEIVQ